MKRFVFSVGGFIFLLIGGKLYDFCSTEFWCQQENGFLFPYSWFLYGGLIALGLGILLDCLPGKLIMFGPAPRRPSMSREQAERYLERLDKEMGWTPYTPAEEKVMEQAERENYNRNTSSATWWSSNETKGTYIDYDGNRREVGDWREDN